ncbi:hypothetical protein BGX31_010080 [Mortierella sp. GBA43]|nr:hypothetical protein BGX31_010080 [Mortierella sp. GBA43]
MSESESARTIRELNEELERWKIEAEEHRQERERWRRESEEHRQERASVEVWQKQISNLERDLEVALFSLQSAEAKVIETKGDQEAVSIKFSEYEKTIETMKADLEDQKSTQEKAQEETTISHGIKVEGLEARNKELEKRLEQAQHEIDQLELQVVPAELQDIHQALFTANQNLEETKRKNEKLTADLAEANANVTRAQEDSSELLSKVSQLQDTIATHIRDNNTLKESLKEHGKCQENAEITAQHQQVLAQERDQKLRLEQALQEHQFQLHQVQQQVQLQQTQLLQQQTEIVNLRATVEVEQKQAALLQQKLQEEQRFNSLQFSRRVSGDGDMSGSFLMIDTVNTGGVSPGLVPMNMNSPESTMSAMSAMNTMASGAPLSRGTPAFSPSAHAALPPLNPSVKTQGLHNIRTFDGLSMTPMQTSPSQAVAAGSGSAGLPPTGVPSGGTTSESEPKPRMIHHGSSGSISGISTSSRLSIHGDSMPSPAATNQSVEELTAQLQGLLKEKEKLQADLSKIPISGGGPMARRKAEILEEQMDENERAISKVRYSIRLRS